MGKVLEIGIAETKGGQIEKGGLRCEILTSGKIYVDDIVKLKDD